MASLEFSLLKVTEDKKTFEVIPVTKEFIDQLNRILPTIKSMDKEVHAQLVKIFMENEDVIRQNTK